MFGFGKNKKIENLEDLKKLRNKEGDNFQNKVKEMADNGNIVCQEYMATLLLKIMIDSQKIIPDPRIHNEFVKYATPVASSGNAGMQFNLGLSYSKSLDIGEGSIDQDGLNRLKEARYWMRKAADQGISEAANLFHTYDGLIESIQGQFSE